MAVIPEGFAQVNLRFTGGDVPSGAEVTWGCSNATDLSPLAIATAVRDIWDGDGVQAIMTNNITLSSILVKLGPNDTGASAELTTNLPGTDSAQSVAPNCSLLIVKSSAHGGKRGKGRSFLPGIPEADVQDGGLIEAGYLATCAVVFTAMLGSLAGGDIDMQLLHSPSYTWELVDGQPRRVPDDPSTVPAPYPVLAWVPAVKAATQRRRLRR